MFMLMPQWIAAENFLVSLQICIAEAFYSNFALILFLLMHRSRNVNPWPRLTNSSHLSESCQEISLSKNVWILRASHHEPPRHQPSDDFAHLCTLGRSIIEGDVKWDGDLCFTGEFRYTKGYWEWNEDVISRYGDRLRHLKIYDVVYASLFTYDHNFDIVKAFCEAWCPLTNTLLTSAGEISISLWDLHELVGLSMTGCLYDEVVPSAVELTGIDEKREIFIPRSNKYLFYAYHLLQSADDNRCSHASIDKWEGLFAKLCIERSLKEEVYLVAYLACWLCVFVLPGKDVNSIRPSTFKIASFMAKCRRVNLAIPVLASMYEGLNIVATSPKPAGGKFIIEPYSPHRFGRQFGYYQDVPRTLKYDTRVASLEEGLRYWCLCVLSKSSSKVWFPCLPVNVKKLCSEAYKLEDEVQSINVGEEFETSHSSTMTPPLRMGLRRKQSPPPTAVSVFKARSLSSEKLSRSLHEQQLKEVKARLQDVQAKASEEASEIQSAMDELEHIEEDILVLKGRRTSLCVTLKRQNNLVIMFKKKFMRSKKTSQHLRIPPH
ncbi:UNVERIFIED_CONTAM: hypothetical protein Scaly_1498900 [Sesamum calycinum]|uniref:Aminotransferase-like plant mobile domain-containing protein n=1 Tax=Sesamum calycinum TaxID=2727403 RepID=A0AAW2PQJ5_9LAMI